MTKRIILLASILLMLLNVCVSADSIDYDYERLYNLNIVSDNYDAYMAKKAVTYKEMITSLIGIVTEDEIADDKILEYAMSRSIISDLESIDAGKAISYERALSLTLNALGYSQIVEYSGNDITAVMKYANDCELTKGIILNIGDNLDGASMIKLLTNAIEAEVMNVVLTDKIGKYEKSDKNPLEAYREIERIIGQITHTEETSLYREDGAGEKRIGIDDEFYDIGYTYSEELLGQTVYAYVKDDVVFHIEPRYDDIKRVEIDSRYIRSIADDFTEIKYEDGRRVDDIKVNPALTVIYNGKNLVDYKKEDLIPKTGKIVCLDTDRDKVYDIVFVYAYETMVVKNVSTAYKVIGNLYDIPECTKTLDLSEDGLNVRFISEGKEVGMGAISVNNVLSVACSKGSDPMITIYIGKEKINGTVSKIDEDEMLVTIGETDYRFNNYYLDAVAAEGSKLEKLSLRNVYDVYLDAFGDVAYAKSDKLDGFEYAYFLKLRWDEAVGTAKIRLLNMDDEWEYVYFAEKVKLNDQGRKEAELVFDDLGGTSMTPHLVLIKKDDKGQIYAIKEPTPSEKYDPEKFTKTQEHTRFYWTGDSSFNCRHYVGYDAIVILRPNDDANIYDEEQYEIATVGYFKDWKEYKYIAYNVDEFGFPGLFEVRDTQTTTSITFYINRLGYTLNEDGDAVKSVTGNISGAENLTLYEIKPGAITANIKPGDVVSVKLRNGKISELSNVDYRPDGEKVYYIPDDDYRIHDGGTQVLGDVVGIDLERSMLLVEGEATDGSMEVLPVYIQSRSEIEVYDEEEREYSIGSINDIYEGNYVRIEMGNNEVISVVVFH